MILPLAAVLLILVFAFLAFSIDVGFMAVTKAELQNSADAAALAGAAHLYDGPNEAVDAAVDYGAANEAANEASEVTPRDITLGFWDVRGRTFDPRSAAPNAVRAAARRTDEGLLFGPILGTDTFTQRAEATAVVFPRDICFVVDLSGSMNDDSEALWAARLVNGKFGPEGYPDIGDELAEELFRDLGFGRFPGRLQHIGGGLVPEDNFAYANLTKDDGPLANRWVPGRYRIREADDEQTRRRKCYSALIDFQLRPLMPGVTPPCDSRTQYDYWEKYLDYVILGMYVGRNPPPPASPDPPPGDGGGGGGNTGGGGGGGNPDPPPPPPDRRPTPPPERPTIGLLWGGGDGPAGLLTPTPIKGSHGPFTPPAPRAVGEVAGGGRAAALSLLAASASQGNPPGTPRRGSTARSEYLPPGHDPDRITAFNNPNRFTFPGANAEDVFRAFNKVGFLTYSQFLLDWGRDRSPAYPNDVNADPDLDGKTPLSLKSPYVRRHTETVAGRRFRFPPRTYPMHSVRRGLIAGLDAIADRNGGPGAVADWVSVVTFDGLGPHHRPEVAFELSPDYGGAMNACAELQAVADVGATTALDPAMLLAQRHLAPPSEGGRGRDFADKIIVVVSDGVPNAWTTAESDVADHRGTLPPDRAGEFYAAGATWLNAPLMHADRWRAVGDTVPVGMGLGADHDYADRLARLSGTADAGGQSARTSGNPARYEQELRAIFDDLLRPEPKLVD